MCACAFVWMCVSGCEGPRAAESCSRRSCSTGNNHAASVLDDGVKPCAAAPPRPPPHSLVVHQLVRIKVHQQDVAGHQPPLALHILRGWGWGVRAAGQEPEKRASRPRSGRASGQQGGAGLGVVRGAPGSRAAHAGGQGSEGMKEQPTTKQQPGVQVLCCCLCKAHLRRDVHHADLRAHDDAPCLGDIIPVCVCEEGGKGTGTVGFFLRGVLLACACMPGAGREGARLAQAEPAQGGLLFSQGGPPPHLPGRRPLRSRVAPM